MLLKIGSNRGLVDIEMINVFNLSFGKDSMATLILAAEQGSILSLKSLSFLTKAANRATKHWNITATKEMIILRLLVARGVTILRRKNNDRRRKKIL